MNAVDYILKPFDKQRLCEGDSAREARRWSEVSRSERLETLVSQLGQSSAAQPVKLLVKSQGRLLLVDAEEMVCASIEDGTITISTREIRGHLELPHDRRAGGGAGSETFLAARIARTW